VINVQLAFKEQELLSPCKKGTSFKEMAEILFVCEDAIKTHRKRILKNLGLYRKREFRKFIMYLVAEELMFQHGKSPRNHQKG
jgi:DNA-binding NarL/FixJ family response regulator